MAYASRVLSFVEMDTVVYEQKIPLKELTDA
jgi:hypothetical protein